MNPALKSALIELKANGVALDPIDDLEHIITLYHLAEAVSTNPPAKSERALLDPVLRVGNLTLKHLSIGAKRWLVDVVAQWFEDDSKLQNMAYIYAMAHADKPEKLWEIKGNRFVFRAKLWWWLRRVTVSWDALNLAVNAFLANGAGDPSQKPGLSAYRAAIRTLDQLVKVPKTYEAEIDLALTAMEEDQDATPVGYGWMIETLCREYGNTPSYWLWQVSEMELDYLLTARRERREAEERAEQGVIDGRFQRAHYRFVTYKDNLLKVRKAKP